MTTTYRSLRYTAELQHSQRRKHVHSSNGIDKFHKGSLHRHLVLVARGRFTIVAGNNRSNTTRSTIVQEVALVKSQSSLWLTQANSRLSSSIESESNVGDIPPDVMPFDAVLATPSHVSTRATLLHHSIPPGI